MVRICAIGDSFTYGQEVSTAYDFPSLLQERFTRRNLGNVEVINFSSGWWGFHQTYVMWDQLARHFDCDQVIFGPQTFYPKRDTAFNHTELYSPYLLHSRYVLRGEDVERLDVLGETHKERFDNYFRMVPRWRYLRYDRNPPFFLEAMIPEGRTLPNPFYYHPGDMTMEAYATYRILLAKIALEDVGTLVSHYAPEETSAVAIARQIGAPNLAALKPLQPTSFPYLAPRGHNSPLGNDFLARQYLLALLDVQGELLPKLVTRDIGPTGKVPGGAARRPLHAFDGIWIESQDSLEIGYFGTHIKLGSISSATHLKENGVAALLSFKSPETSVLNGCFVALDFVPEPSAEVVLHVAGAEPARYLLGELQWLDGMLALGVLNIRGAIFRNQEVLILNGGDDVPVKALTTADRVTVRIGQKIVLAGQGGQSSITLKPVLGRCRRLRTAEDAFLDLDILEQGRFDLVLSHAQDGSFKVPLATWSRTMVAAPAAEPTLGRTLVATDEGVVRSRAPQ